MRHLHLSAAGQLADVRCLGLVATIEAAVGIAEVINQEEVDVGLLRGRRSTETAG